MNIVKGDPVYVKQLKQVGIYIITRIHGELRILISKGCVEGFQPAEIVHFPCTAEQRQAIRSILDL